MHPQCPLVVIRMIAFQRPNHAEVIGDIADVRKQVADHQPGLPARAKLPVGTFEVPREITSLALPVVDSDLFAMIPEQCWLVIK